MGVLGGRGLQTFLEARFMKKNNFYIFNYHKIQWQDAREGLKLMLPQMEKHVKVNVTCFAYMQSFTLVIVWAQ